MPLLHRLALLATLAASLGAQAQNASLTAGEVRKVDAANSRITLKHGDIKNLNMPGMTMVFVAKDPALLKGLAVGDKVEFAAEQGANGQLLVTQIAKAK